MRPCQSPEGPKSSAHRGMAPPQAVVCAQRRLTNADLHERSKDARFARRLFGSLAG